MAHNSHDRSDRRSEGFPRRRFLKLAAMTGLLAGCSSARQALTTTTAFPSATDPPTLAPTRAPTLTPTHSPTSALTVTDTASPPPTQTPASTATPTQTATRELMGRRPDVIQTYPDVPSRVVQTRHAGAWDGGELTPASIREMLDASISRLTGLHDAREAWAALFDPGERVAIKVNAFRNSLIWTHVPLVMAVTDALQEVGIPARNILIFDYYTRELQTAGFPVNQHGPGVRCFGTDRAYTGLWPVVDGSVQLSDLLLDCDALINMPVLKSHMLAGMSLAMKNHYGSISLPQTLHLGVMLDRGMADLNALPPIRDRTRLIIGDLLEACLQYANSYPYWQADWTGDSILMSFDPVAHDAVGLELLSRLMAEAGLSPAGAVGMATPWLESGREVGLGTNNLEELEWVEASLG